jgi:hypothetical protein
MKAFLLACCVLWVPLFSHAVVLNDHTGAYVTWWEADDLEEGTGFGLSKDLRLLGIVFVEGNVGYVDFKQGWIVPLEVSLNLKFPLPLTPYIGVGTGYYFSDLDQVDSDTGTHIKVGGRIELLGIGLYGEARTLDLEEDALDGYSLLVGVTLRY